MRKRIVCTHVNHLDPPPEVAAFVDSFGGRNFFGQPLYRIVWANRHYKFTQDRLVKSYIPLDKFCLEAWQPEAPGLSRGRYQYVDDFVANDGESFCWPSIEYAKAIISKHRTLQHLDRVEFERRKANEVELQDREDVENLYDQIHDYVPRSVGAPTIYQPGRAAH